MSLIDGGLGPVWRVTISWMRGICELLLKKRGMSDDLKDATLQEDGR